ncbi:winged helix-turn-helix domain-containing protein [Sphingomicrobium aestuariivivum]|uniref:winged helix-turn-helix domain-containing protein n=1 Tax=Sphingomicrobium aestuariivivum TaxID=1582356 RepID=UPI001FD675A7|nr:transcriptional regulator [Sphingomicrobium aestuariivivum]MCJ8191339.1 transcriptional regulator [Sphingomicrobium aestuariivivum]
MSDATTYGFGPYLLAPHEARLTHDGSVVPLQPRTFDLLVHFVRHPATLHGKDALFEAVWPGVTVGDEALTQAIKDLRKALGDSATEPAYIETVRGRGYRFIAPVETSAPSTPASRPHGQFDLVLAGTLGGGMAGLAGGLVYGLSAGIANDAWLPILLVMTTLTTLVALLGAFALCTGMAVASRLAGRRWLFSAVGAGLGGFIIGDLFHLLASGSFSVLLGTEHRDFTGGLEGLILGGAIAAGAQMAGGTDAPRRRVILGAGLAGAFAGALILIAGGKLMAASLGALARQFHGASTDLGAFGALSEGAGALPVAVGAFEGLLYGAAISAAILLRLHRKAAEITTSSPPAHAGEEAAG